MAKKKPAHTRRTKKAPPRSAARRPRPARIKLKPKAKKRQSQVVTWVAAAILLIGILAGIFYFGVIKPAQRKMQDALLQWDSPPPMMLDPNVDYTAILHTEKGDITIDLFEKETPLTVNNFVFLARKGYYDNTTFHRVIPGFIAQAGDPTGTGSGGPGYTFADEIVETLHHDSEGVVSMANRGPNTNGSQFFITYGPAPHLDGAHTIFGRVIAGMEVVRALTPRDPSENPDAPPGDRIETIEIVEQ